MLRHEPARARRLAALALTVASVLLASGCDVGTMDFRRDTRMHFTAPASRALVQLPVTVSWRMRDFAVAAAGSAKPSGAAGYYAVFVDRAPVKPGETVRALADRSCGHTSGCPDAAYLQRLGVYTTTTPTITLEQIPALNGYQKVQTHEVTVVLMGTDGRRIGEGAWYVDFRTQKPTL